MSHDDYFNQLQTESAISSPDDKLTGDLGNVIEATRSGGRRLIRVIAGKLSPGNFRLLQQYLPQADKVRRSNQPFL